MSAPRALLILAVGLLPIASGCAGARIRDAYTERHARPVELTRSPQAKVAADAGTEPYHLAFRASPRLMDRVLTAMLSQNLIEAMQSRAGQEGASSPGDEGQPVTGQTGSAQRRASGDEGAAGTGQPQDEGRPRRGPFGGARGGGGGLGIGPGGRGQGEGGPGPLGQALMDRLADRMGGRMNLGNLSPDLHAEAVKVGFLPDCDGCLRLQLDLRGGLSAPEMREISLGGQVTLKANVASVTDEGRPALAVRLDEVEQLRIELPISLPGPFSQLQARLEDALRDRVTAMLREKRDDATQVMPLADRFKMGPGVELEGLGVRTAPSPNGELFLGIDTNLTARPAVTFDGRGGALTSADWSILVSEEVVAQLVQQAAHSGKMPTRFDRKGRPDAEGPVAFDLDRVRFTPAGFEMDVRLWYLSFPAWWRDYTISGTIAVQEGQLRPQIEKMTPGQGDGATWVSRFVEKKVTSSRAVKGMGRTMPDTLPLPTAEDKAAKLTPTRIQPLQGVLAIEGLFEVVDVVPEGTEGEAAPLEGDDQGEPEE